MNSNNWMPNQGSEPTLDYVDLRVQLHPEFRQNCQQNNGHIKKKHIPEEKEDEATWENQGDPKWGSEAESIDVDADGEVAGFEEEPSEELKIFAGNFPFDVDSERLAGLFEQTPGTVETAEVIYNRDTDKSHGFGFVTMSTTEEE
ncbi:hypothetical protein RYX36_009281 [Vicia faba]